MAYSPGIFWVALILGALVSNPAPAAETVRILMGESPRDVLVRGEGLSFGPDDEEAPFTPLDGPASLRAAAGKLLLGGRPIGEVARFRSTGAGIFALGKQVRGEVVVKLHRSGLQLINVLPLEEYLVAVLGSEMPPWFPLEALKAQAVAARTYALRKKLSGYGDNYHLGSSVLHQVYGGLSREDARTKAAVEATSGLVLTFGMEPIEAYFHASCGGRTETGFNALGRDLPYLASVECPCGRSLASHWSLTLPFSELRSLFGNGDVRSVRVVGRTSTGRATRVEGGGRSVDAVSFRRRVGYDRLKSLSFDLQGEVGDGVYIVGRGHGHGAGLCQWGAKALAEQGTDYQQILFHYYPGAQLQQIY